MRQTLVVLTALVLLTAACPAAAAPPAAPRDFVVKVGMLEPGSANTNTLRETQELTMDPSRRPGWCFLVDPPNAEAYDVYSIHYLPGVPKSLTGDFEGTAPDRVAGGLKTATERAEGVRTFCCDFERGDPLGDYRIEVFINGALKRTVRLHVVAPPLPVAPAHSAP